MKRQLAESLAKPFLSISELKTLLRTDASARSLAFSNLFTIVLALIEQWPLKTVMFIYCGQNIIIGFFNIVRILSIKEIVVKERPGVEVPSQARYFLAGFFTLHYGLFNFGYFQFVGVPVISDWGWVRISLLAFFVHHLFSFRHNFRKEAFAWDFVRLMVFPYFRIIPMHVIIIFGGFLTLLFQNELTDRLLLIFFLLLKTNVDLKMHQVEHNRQERTQPEPDNPLPED
mgnify:CR=1 FL=1